jgi:hypothetical protein
MGLTIGSGIGTVLEPKDVTTRPDAVDESGSGRPIVPLSDGRDRPSSVAGQPGHILSTEQPKSPGNPSPIVSFGALERPPLELTQKLAP